MRSIIYDALPTQLVALAGTIDEKNNLLKKSKEENSIHENMYDIMDEITEAELLGKKISKSFILLRNDFVKGEVNQAFYIDYIGKFKEFFSSGVEKIDLPKSLPVSEILKEIEIYSF